ncbi:MAG TPA: SH3 domain-containing protein, partial [Pyrinomonadaceae bacterium]|nr:SH3 domain-containing protein [Pyrinomonadaceae bacterium]
FSQRPVSELPTPPSEEEWASEVARVLERATQTNPSDRYQTVGEFWNELRRAAGAAGADFDDASEVVAPPKAEVRRERAEEELTPAPAHAPAPSFERPIEPTPARPGARDGRIFIPIEREDARPAPARGDRRAEVWEDARPHAREESSPDYPPPSGFPARRGARRARKLLIVFLVLVAFAALLLATANYVRNRNGGAGTTPSGDAPALVGREFVAVTDVNLRAAPSGRSAQVGMASRGSTVRVVAASGGWYQVQVVQYGRPKEREDYADEGWADRDFLRPKQ